jgi:hypothetical protein
MTRLRPSVLRTDEKNPPREENLLTERRKRDRLSLRLPVRFLGADGSWGVSCWTENISSTGFYCFCPERLMVGERREVQLSLPARGYSRGGGSVDLYCQVRVMRIEPVGLGPGFGVACAIQKYALTLEEASR